MNTMKHLKPGDPVLMIETRGARQTADFVVTKVARKFGHAVAADGSKTWRGEIKFALDNGSVAGGWDCRISTIEREAEAAERENLIEQLRVHGLVPNHGVDSLRDVSTEALGKVVAVLDEDNAGR